MKLKFKKQQFQEDSVNAVCDVFQGQPKKNLENYGLGLQGRLYDDLGYKNNEIVLSRDLLLENINKIQSRNRLKESEKLEGQGINLTIEMETGTGKTYAYINTIYELNKRFNWSKFVVIVPSIAIREGVFKSFEIMKEHFASLYGKKVNFFIFDSSKPTEIENFARSTSISVMIVNNHAFNKQETNNMFKTTETGRTLMQIISGTNPILIIDEPQSVEGKKTKEVMLGDKGFNALFTLRYSATHRESYNMVYCLDAVDAFNKKLVKKINVKGISIKGNTATHGYLYLEGIDISQTKLPKARIEIDIKQKGGNILRKSLKFSEGDDLFVKSGELKEYKGYRISEIDGLRNLVRFTNGNEIHTSEVVGEVNEEHKRRIQIRETIKSHLNKERINFEKGIKTISLIFIDEVAKYRIYDEQGNQGDGLYAKMFLEEYQELLERERIVLSEDYKIYLDSISPKETHKGYFSIDKKNRLVDPKEKGRGIERTSDDVSAYDLIMKDKEKLLDLKEPTRFIFSHSALREGWDNPNVFQICVLRNTDPAEVRTRQEVGRGLRLCVDFNGERVDQDYSNADFSEINVLTIIANDSYEDFAEGLQKELLKELRERPTKLTEEFLTKRKLNGTKITQELAKKIIHDFIKKDYIDEEDRITEKCKEAIRNNALELSNELEIYKKELIEIVQEVYLDIPIRNEDNTKTLKNRLNDNFNHPEFKKFWSFICSKTTYEVDFDSNLLINNCTRIINQELNIIKTYAEVTQGTTKEYITKMQVKERKLFGNKKVETEDIDSSISHSIKYDLIGEISTKTNLTRKTIFEIISKIEPDKFKKYQLNPEVFISKVSKIINDEKAEIILNKIIYKKTKENFSIDIFKDKVINKEAVPLDNTKYIYEFLDYDSDVERRFGQDLNSHVEVLVFSKLPKGDYEIYTPVGSFSPDWMIVFNKDKVTHAYFIAETKGKTSGLELRGVEKAKIACAKKHFEAISGKNVKFDAVASFEELKEKIH
jgi:type III restriction enzyme